MTPYAVVAQFEIRRAQSAHGLAPIGDKYIHADGERARAKLWLLESWNGARQQQRHQRKRDAQLSRHATNITHNARAWLVT